MTKYTKVVLIAGLCAAFVVGGFALMSPTKAATSLEDSASLSLNNTFTGTINQFPSVYIGSQGVGGVTFFNGTIINATTDAAGDGIPVTLGDDLRVDGRVWRGETAGPGDTLPFIVNDNMEIGGNVDQGLDYNGIWKAAVHVADDGTIINAMENLTDTDPSPTATNDAVGTFTVDFNFDVSDRFIQVTTVGPYATPTSGSVVVAGETVRVIIVDEAGAYTDAEFYLMVF